MCINVPTWGGWTYWDLDAQNGPGATDEQAARTAIDFFDRVGADPGDIISIEPNGPLPQVRFTSRALVMVGVDQRIAMLIAPTALLPIL